MAESLEELVLRTWEGIGRHVEGLGADVVRSVDANLRSDAASAGRLGRVGDRHQQR
ncbi:hypothetical protein AB0J85_30035 [Micromonospora echinofusca]|uniref:hypothetical protein n=1 Tax=Micromonospora echinofusca TaxID=47858 RepID=UPI00341947CD